MVSFILINLLLLFIFYKSLRFTIKHFCPLPVLLAIVTFAILFAVWKTWLGGVHVQYLDWINYYVTNQFYWRSSLLIMISLIVLGDFNRNIYINKTTTELVRKATEERARFVRKEQ